MITIRGKYNTAKVFTMNIGEETVSQIVELLNQDFVSGATVRIMPDCHKGAGCVIGFTANLGTKVIPNLVGVDIGCGMLVVNLGKIDIDLSKTDDVIHNFIPSGKSVHPNRMVEYQPIRDLFCKDSLKGFSRIENSIGTLGGGNHFIELDKDDDENIYLVIHSGSRNLGKQVAEHYQEVAVNKLSGKSEFENERVALINNLKINGNSHRIQSALRDLEKKFNNLHPPYPKDLCFLENLDRSDYLNDMEICQLYAQLNRDTMAEIILSKLVGGRLKDFEFFHTIHNYIDFEDNVIRKGAVRASRGESLIIPMNMRDGSLLCIGKGNDDWNNSAPHGAGRIMSRSEAKRQLDLGDFQNEMLGIFSTTVNQSTLDEAPMAYKPMQEIIDNIGDTVKIQKIIKPIYNFKASE